MIDLRQKGVSIARDPVSKKLVLIRTLILSIACGLVTLLVSGIFIYLFLHGTDI